MTSADYDPAFRVDSTNIVVATVVFTFDHDCGQEFSLSLADVAQFYQANPEGQMACPQCTQPGAERAQRCGVCSRAVSRAVATAARACPHCKSPLGRPAP